MDFLYLIFYARLRLRFLDVETNPGPRCPVPAVRRIFCVLWEPYDLTVASSQYDILWWSETLVSDMRHMSELLFPGFGRNVFLVGARCIEPEGWLQTYEIVTEHFNNPNLSVVHAKICF